MNERMHDLAFQIDDGTIRLEQRDYGGESCVIDLHPCQLRYIAERAGLLEPALEAAAMPTHLQRRVRALHSRIAEFYDCEFFFNEIYDQCSSGPEMWLHIRAIFEMAEDLVTEQDTCQAHDDGRQRNGKEPARERNENSMTISVTESSETRRAGRPATGEAMSNAARQKAYRDRKAGKDTESLPLALDAPG